MTHKNYKQKYLEALEGRRVEPLVTADRVRLELGNISTTNTDAAVTLRKVTSTLGEVSLAAQSLLSEMDDHTNVGGLAFGTVSHEIDTKLTKMPAEVAMRRIRDLLKIAEARIAMLHIQADDLNEANQILTDSVKRAETSRLSVQRALYETAWVGPGATTNEIEDFNDAAAGTYARENLSYHDDAEDFIMTKLFAGTSLRTKVDGNTHVRTYNSDEESESGSDDDVDTQTLVRMNRSAQVVPASPIATRSAKIDL